MEAILGERIKEIITRYPEVGSVLNDFGVTCVTCAVGTCLLKDILNIHRLSPEDEQKMMMRIAGIVYPGQNIVVPLRKSDPSQKTKVIKYSPPMQQLVNEHKLIKRVLAAIPAMARNIDLATDQGRQMALSATDFIRSYADKYHHAKEEDLLFKLFDESLDILKVMHQDHEAGRAHVRAVVSAVECHDTGEAVKHLSAYRELLTEHIKKEDEILYPWLDRQLSDSQIGRLYSAFSEVDVKFADTCRRCEEIVAKLEHSAGQV